MTKYFRLGLKPILAFVILVGLVIFGQQCARVSLEEYEKISFLSLGKNPTRLDPPIDYPIHRRIVFLVDMSQSMVSGPCIQDVDAGIGFSTTPTIQVFDPNKGTGNGNDHRADGIDCRVNRNLPIERSSIVNTSPNILGNPPTFFETHLGMDHEGNRLGLLQNWIAEALATNPEFLIQTTKIAIIPVSGGISQTKLENAWRSQTGESTPFRFYDLREDKLSRLIGFLRSEHVRNLSLSESDDVWRYETRTMGTSSPGGILERLYELVQADMRLLNGSGDLTFSEYQVIHLTDGQVSPIRQYIQNTLSVYAPCASCAANPASCLSMCGTLTQRLYDAWGLPDENAPSNLDFNFGLIQALPRYFGAGNVRLDFVQLQKDRFTKAYPGVTPYFEALKPLFRARSATLTTWTANDDKPPFRLTADMSKLSSYRVTHLFVLNPNVRLAGDGTEKVDSDGDGVFDDHETVIGMSPINPRSNGFCLDSFIADSAFKARCEAMARSFTCDPSVDSDGDSLNECEEKLLGTDAFDFDTDGDAIPDSLEWIYGFNPLHSDEGLDSNGDSYLNLINFASNLGPNDALGRVKRDALALYEVNSKGKETVSHPALGDVMLELFEVIVHNVPHLQGLSVNRSALPSLYMSRLAQEGAAGEANLIPYSQQLLSAVPSNDRTPVLAIARMIEAARPERAYWRVFKTDVPLSGDFAQAQLDLSQFKLIRAIDRGAP